MTMEIAVPRGPDRDMLYAKVKREALSHEGEPMGTPNDNPILDSRMYEVQYLDGSTEVMAANTIVEKHVSGGWQWASKISLG